MGVEWDHCVGMTTEKLQKLLFTCIIVIEHEIAADLVQNTSVLSASLGNTLLLLPVLDFTDAYRNTVVLYKQPMGYTHIDSGLQFMCCVVCSHLSRTLKVTIVTVPPQTEAALVLRPCQ